MTEYELDKIKKSICPFQCQVPCRGSLPAHCYKILQRKRNGHTYIDRMVQNKWKAYLGRNETRAISFGMKAEICLQNIHQLTQRKLPIILFTLNDFNVPGYVSLLRHS